jgi:glycosyltransferase involved in cell wall biosynthesis
VIDLYRLRERFYDVERRHGFDVIHSASYAAPGYLLARNRAAPLVCRLSSHSPTVRAAFGRKANAADLLNEWLETQLARQADVCFAPSALVARQFERVLGRPVEVVRTAVERFAVAPDLAFFEQHRPRGPYLIFFGTLSRIKGIDVLAEILPSILQRHRELHMLFIGRDDGLPDGTPMFAHVAASVGKWRDRIAHIPALPRARLYPFIENALAALIPSRVDNYPNTCLEAQSLGVPVVGTNGSSLDEMIEDRVTGFLARNGDAEQLEDAIERLLRQSTTERAQMRQRILTRVAEIEREDRIGQLIALYQRTISRFVGRRRSVHV